jgi:hypothetical protein
MNPLLFFLFQERDLQCSVWSAVGYVTIKEFFGSVPVKTIVAIKCFPVMSAHILDEVIMSYKVSHYNFRFTRPCTQIWKTEQYIHLCICFGKGRGLSSFYYKIPTWKTRQFISDRGKRHYNLIKNMSRDTIWSISRLYWPYVIQPFYLQSVQAEVRNY